MFELRCVCCSASYADGDIDEAKKMGWTYLGKHWGCPLHRKGDGMQDWYRAWRRGGYAGTTIEQRFFQLGYELANAPTPKEEAQ